MDDTVTQFRASSCITVGARMEIFLLYRRRAGTYACSSGRVIASLGLGACF